MSRITVKQTRSFSNSICSKNWDLDRFLIREEEYLEVRRKNDEETISYLKKRGVIYDNK